jgi:hypothetical protein
VQRLFNRFKDEPGSARANTSSRDQHFIDRAENEGIEMVVAFEASRP